MASKPTTRSKTESGDPSGSHRPSPGRWNRRVLALLAPVGCAVALAAAVSGRGCENREAAPKETVRVFLEAANELDREKMFSMLSQRTQEVLEAQAREATDRSSRRYLGYELIGIDSELSVFDTDEAPREISLVSQTDETATVEIVDNVGNTHRIELVRENDRWHLDLLANNPSLLSAP